MEMIRSLKLKPPVIIKPNWGFSVVFTEAQVLDWVLAAIDGEALVVESYGWARYEEALTKKEYDSMERTTLKRNDQWFLKYSGLDKALMDQSILDINKIYHALFTVKGVVEAIFVASRGMSLDQVIYENPKLAWASEDTLELDAVVAAHVGKNPREVGHLNRVAEFLGKWDETGVVSARRHVIDAFQATLDHG